MAQAILAAPSKLPVGLQELKAHLRVEGETEDEYLNQLIGQATDHLEAVCGKKLIRQSWKVYFDAIPGDGIVELPSSPLDSVIQVDVYDAKGVRHSVPLSGLEIDKASNPPRIRFLSAPRAGRKTNGIEIHAIYGYGSDSDDVPAALRRALLQLCAHWNELRGSGVDAAAFGLEPEGFRRLIQPFRSVNL